MTQGTITLNGAVHPVSDIRITVANPTPPFPPSQEMPVGQIEISGTLTVNHIDMNALRRISLEQHMRMAGIGEQIIERVLRLNPVIDPGRKLRGIHFKASLEPQRMYGWMKRSEVVGWYGRATFDLIPRGKWRRHGRRIFVSRAAAQQARWPTESA